MRKFVALVVGLVVVLWGVYKFWYLSGLPPCPPVAEIAARIRQHPAAQQCANVSVAVESCVIGLQGRIENAAQRARLREAAQKIRGIRSIDDALLHIVGVPFCEILDLLEPLQKHAETHNLDFKVRLVNKENQKLPVYMQGENLIIEVTTPAQFESFVYVDYYTADGLAQHLFPNLREEFNFFPPRSVYTVGQPDNRHVEWKPFPPFGRELISVIVTRQPLVFTPKAPRYDPEPFNLYLDQLRAALPRALAQAEIGAAIYTIETRGPENP